MASQHSLQTSLDQDAVLAGLTELVIIMQQEAEDLLTLADLVEEYVEEVDVTEQVAGIEDWADDLDLGYYGADDEELEREVRQKHSRDDSAVSLNAGDAFLAGELRESVCEEAPESREVRIRDETVVLQPVAHNPVVETAGPVVKAPMPRILKAKKSISKFRDSGVSLFTPRSSVKSKNEKKNPRWM